jgi:hypothetical protein
MKAGGRLVLAVFRPGPENPWATASLGAIRHLVTPPGPPPGPEEPGQFSWGDPARVRRILESAWFGQIALQPLDVMIPLGVDASEAADFAMSMGPGARLLTGAPDATRNAARTAFEEFFRQHQGQEGVRLPGALWLVSALN